MKLCRFDQDRLGVVVGDDVFDVTDCLSALPPRSYPFPTHDLLIESLPKLRPLVAAATAMSPRMSVAATTLLAPVANVGKVVAAPVNYHKHLEEVLGDASLHHHNKINEIQKAGLFLKATSSIVGPGQGIRLCQSDRRTDHEVELVAVMGRTAANVSADEALSYVAGYTIGLDMTIRGPEERSFRKSPDTYTVLGPWLVTADEVPNPGALLMELRVNGELRQRASTSQLILGVAELVALASSFYTLHPGDVLFTGTCEGVGPVAAGDVIDACIEGLGRMSVGVTSNVWEST